MGKKLVSVVTVAVVALFGGVAVAGSKQQRLSAMSRAKSQAEKFLSRLEVEAGFTSDSQFSRTETNVVADHICLRNSQLVSKVEVLGTYALSCFGPTGVYQEKSAAVCNGECLKNRESAQLGDQEISRLAEDQMKSALLRDFSKLKLSKNPFVTVLNHKVNGAWIKAPSASGIRQLYLVDFTTAESPGKFVAYMDGISGSLLGYEYRIWTAEGEANVYLRDPTTTAELQKVWLHDLVSIDHLENANYVVTNEDMPSASSPEGNYAFEPSDSHFSEAQVYYGLEFAFSKLTSIGYEPFGPIPVTVHYDTNYNNAFYDGSMIAIGDGDGKVLKNLSLDNTVVTHEYGHAIIDHLAHLKMFPIHIGDVLGQGPAIHEGHADYFACMAYDKPTLGEGVMPDGQPMRMCNLNLSYSERNGEPHYAGQVWSGALWEVRNTIGQERTDRISLDLLMRIKPTGMMGTTKMVDMYRAVLASNQALFGGADKVKINEIFERRGFGKAKDDDDGNEPDKPKWPSPPFAPITIATQ